jgi:hypothetical protein
LKNKRTLRKTNAKEIDSTEDSEKKHGKKTKNK